MPNKLDYYDTRSIEQIRASLGGWEFGRDENTEIHSTLISACMILCDQVANLENCVKELGKKIEELDKSVYRASNTASCLANGVIPD